jgi:uncharacterized protein (DUF1786 family)
MKFKVEQLPDPVVYPEDKVENAFEALLQALQTTGRLQDNGKNIPIALGFENVKIDACPFISIIAAESLQEMKGNTQTNNWNMQVHVTLFSNVFDHTRDAHRKWSAELRDALLDENLKDNLNETNTTFFIRVIPSNCQRMNVGENNQLRATTQTMEIYCFCSKPQ